MTESTDTSPLERFCALLADAGVEFMVVGGQAEVLERHLGRPKDRESLLQLEAITRLRDQEGLR